MTLPLGLILKIIQFFNQLYEKKIELFLKRKKTIRQSLNYTPPKDKSSPTKDKMSIAGVGNAAAGTITADFIKNLLTKDDNKAATKGDMKLLTEKLLGRYHPIKNMPPHTDGSYPYYDLINQKLVYVANLKAFH